MSERAWWEFKPDALGGEKMKRMIVAILISLLWINLGFAGTADQAKGMVDEGAAFMQANGKEKALAEMNNPKGKFVKGELYIFVYDFSGTVLAQPFNPKLVGKNVMEVPDADGKFFRKEIIELAKSKGQGWVDYKYKNPASNKIEHKTAYIRKVNDVVLGCGTYK
jgi:signal transduction histidine kinase